MIKLDEQKQENHDSRLPYTSPDLVEAGNIADLTKSNPGTGSDGGYS